MKYILALDQGTTSSRAIVFDHSGSVVASAQKEFRQIFPKPGWVEHDATEIWATQKYTATEALGKAGLTAADIAAVGITNQRETTVAWDRETGEPVHHAIVWQDRRTAAACDRLKARGLAPLIKRKTGLVVDAYFSGTKLEWLLRNVPGARGKAKAGKLAFGTVDSWLVENLTGGRGLVERSVRRDDAVRRQGPDRRDGGRPAGRAVRPGVHPARDGEEHLRHRLLHAHEHGSEADRLQEQSPDHGGVAHREAHRVRPGRQHFHRRGGGAVAARRPRDHQVVVRGGSPGLAGDRSAGGVPRPRVRRPGGAALGSIRARPARRRHARHDGGAYRARGARGNCVPGGGCAAGDGGRCEDQAQGAAGGWRRVREQPVDAVPVESAGRACSAPQSHRDDGTGRSVSRRI